MVASSNKLTNLNISIQSNLPENDNVEWVEMCWDHNKWLLSVDKKNQLDVTFCILSLQIVAQHVSGNHVPIIRS